MAGNSMAGLHLASQTRLVCTINALLQVSVRDLLMLTIIKKKQHLKLCGDVPASSISDKIQCYLLWNPLQFFF